MRSFTIASKFLNIILVVLHKTKIANRKNTVSLAKPLLQTFTGLRWSIFFIFQEFKILKPKWVIEKKRLVNKCHDPHKLLTPQQLFAANNFILEILSQIDCIFCLNSIAVITLSKPTHFVLMKHSTMEYLSSWIKSKSLNCRTPCQSKTHLESVATLLRSGYVARQYYDRLKAKSRRKWQGLVVPWTLGKQS